MKVWQCDQLSCRFAHQTRAIALSLLITLAKSPRVRVQHHNLKPTLLERQRRTTK
ncbi:hypothetical protein BJP36_39870 [Moorena producens JHB]|uniref:Uncharacterized protein n=1 Tax=Moorena producens (strain JHB) TaxID=1454205 RepID=A0A9Q9SV40_MOOP1|nr:hypothetical protein [Moorena producens]WAN70213.1 hypothetical protein BJP36_39870 [Moorena producens JHB]